MLYFIIQGALEDFDKTARTESKKDKSTTRTTSSATETPGATIPPEQTWSYDFIKQTADQFEKKIHNLIQNGENFRPLQTLP